MKLKTIIWQTAVTVLALTSAGQLMAAEHFGESKENRGQFTSRDYRFVTEAAQGGMSEIRLGELAKQKGGSQAVRDFGQRMITDHSKANDELRQIVSNKGATIPTEMSRKANSEIDRFEKLSGPEFDKAYIEFMVKDHKKDLKEFKDGAEDVSDPDLKNFAQKTASVIEEHLRTAEDLEKSVK
jgi:putative membrane protein